MESANHSITNSATLKFFLQLKHTAENIITAVAEKLSWLSLLQYIYIYILLEKFLIIYIYQEKVIRSPLKSKF